MCFFLNSTDFGSPCVILQSQLSPLLGQAPLLTGQKNGLQEWVLREHPGGGHRVRTRQFPGAALLAFKALCGLSWPSCPSFVIHAPICGPPAPPLVQEAFVPLMASKGRERLLVESLDPTRVAALQGLALPLCGIPALLAQKRLQDSARLSFTAT